MSPPRRQLYQQNLPDNVVLEIWSLLKPCNFPGGSWTINGDGSPSVSAHGITYSRYPAPWQAAGARSWSCLWEQESCPPNIWICVLTMEVQTQRQVDIIAAGPSPSTETTSRDFRDQHFDPPPHPHFLFPLWDPDIED